MKLAASAPRFAVNVSATSPDDARRAITALSTESACNAAILISAIEKVSSGTDGALDLPELIDTLRDQATAVQGGNLAYVEAMLINQATTLQFLYVRLTARGMSCETIPGFEVNTRLALRAQNQCRATLETLVAIKNPPVVFAKQANIAHGHQQVNNNEAKPVAHAEIKNRPNKLLEDSVEDAEWVDVRPARKASKSHPAVAAVAPVNRAKVRGGEGRRRP